MRTTSIAKLTVGLVAAATLGTAVAATAGGSSDPTYRTATASEQSVDQLLATVGTIEPVSQASVAFPTAGTVAGVSVAVGDPVTVGTPLASLDTEALRAARNEAQASLDQAELVLQLALDGDDPSSVLGGAPAGGAFGRPVRTPSGALAEARQAVVDASAAVSDALAVAEAAAANADAVCGATDADAASCQDALAASLAAQQQLVAAQQELVAAIDALTELLEQLADEAASTTTTTEPAPTPTVPAAPSGGSTTLPSAGSATTGGDLSPTTTSTSPSAEDLVAYQEAVDAAELAVAVADQALDQAEIVSPIVGTVVSVGLAAGDEVEAASATQAIVVVGDGGFEVTTEVSVTDLPDLAVGQAASVVPDGVDEAIDGEVVAIGVAPSSGSTTYPVTIALTGDTGELGNGATASVAIETASVADALAVPTSAVTVDGDTTTVTRLVDGDTEVVEIEIGAIGSTWTEVTEGLDAGDEVVLADLDAPLPGSATDSSSSGSTGGSFVPGGGFPGGGIGGGGPPSGN
jgi:HlyD family secretion protein